MTMAVIDNRIRSPLKSHLLYMWLGLAAGVVTRLSDFSPNDDVWSFSSIATLFGFWVVSVTLIICFSSSNINAAFNVLWYLLSMNFSFYYLKYVLGLFIARFDGEFQWDLFILYTVFAFVCSLISYVLYYWNKESKLASLLYALPISGLAAETIGVGIYFVTNHTFLFQFIFDFFSFVILGGWFYQKAPNKLIFRVTVLAVALPGFLLVYRPFL